MKTVLLIICLTFCKAMAFSQMFYQGELTKTFDPTFKQAKYKFIPIGLGAGYQLDVFTVDVGVRTNWSEYYTLVHAAVGGQSKGKLLVAANFGIGWTLNLPLEDRKYTNGQYEYISYGFDKNFICAAYGNAKLGYQIFDGCYLYGSYSFSYKWQWVSVGIKLSNTKK